MLISAEPRQQDDDFWSFLEVKKNDIDLTTPTTS